MRENKFYAACAAGRLRDARSCAIGARDIRGYGDAAFAAACAGGHTAVAAWLATNHPPLATLEALRRACDAGSVVGVQWLFANMPTLAKEADTDSFLLACQNGYLPLLKILAETWALTAETARADAALRYASEAGHVAVIEWLVDHFGMPTDADFEGALFLACASGHVPVASWLCTRGGISAARVRSLGCLDAAATAGKLDMVNWLRARFGMRAAEIGDAAVRVADIRGLSSGSAWKAALMAKERKRA